MRTFICIVACLWSIVATYSASDMQTIQDSAINEKTRELCQTILDQPQMRSARQRIETFVADEKARTQYEGLMAKGQALQQKQQRSQQLSGEEISQFEKEREALLNNPVARGFLEAQEEMHHVHQSINQFVSKTLELGRMPTAADFESDEGCGDGCGCGHNH
jgi:cell fate (sporulation/competence/biofilm development) regulator YlbF (YheA/YmcA/DUF963 family)